MMVGWRSGSHGRTVVRRYFVIMVMVMAVRALRAFVRVQVQVVAVFFGRVEM